MLTININSIEYVDIFIRQILVSFSATKPITSWDFSDDSLKCLSKIGFPIVLLLVSIFNTF